MVQRGANDSELLITAHSINLLFLLLTYNYLRDPRGSLLGEGYGGILWSSLQHPESTVVSTG